MQDQQTAPPPDQERTYPEFDRRRGPRRAGEGDVQVGTERRGPDRRQKKPGFAGLWGAIFGNGRSAEEETPKT
jgi:hypothetical protein